MHGTLCWSLDIIEKLLLIYGVVIKSSTNEEILRKTYSDLCEVVLKLPESQLKDEQIQAVLNFIIGYCFSEVKNARSYYMQMKAVKLINVILSCLNNHREALKNNVQSAARDKEIAAQLLKKFEAISSDDFQQVRRHF